MNAMRIQMVVVKSAQTQTGLIFAPVTMAIALPPMDTCAMVFK